jgi:hypothetical protein
MAKRRAGCLKAKVAGRLLRIDGMLLWNGGGLLRPDYLKPL